MYGAGHEGGQRAGTENILLVCGLGAACALATDGLDECAAKMAARRDRLQVGDDNHPATACTPPTPDA